MQVAFWSTVHGQTATTSNLIAIALMIALEYRFNSVLTHNHYTKSTLEDCILDEGYMERQKSSLNDVGMDALGRHLRFNMSDAKEIKNYTTSLIRNRLDILLGTKNASEELFISDISKQLEGIFLALSKAYELVLVDATSGLNDLSKMIINKTDVLVVCLNQNSRVLDDYFENIDPDLHDKTFYIIGVYDQRSRYNIATIRRKYKIKGNRIGGIPYCRAFADACNEGRIIDFFIKNQFADKDEDCFEFVSGVRKCTSLLLDYMGYDTKVRRLDSV